MFDIAYLEMLKPIALVGCALVLLSVVLILLGDRQRFIDHIARSLVAVGVACLTVAAAFTIYNWKLSDDKTKDFTAAKQRVSDEQEQDRQQVIQSFRRAILQYGIAAYQIRSSRYYCDIYTDDMKNIIAMRKSDFNSASCQEAAAFAIKTSALLPGVDSVFMQARGSEIFRGANSLAIFVTDGNAALRARMPAVIETNLNTYLTRGRTSGAPPAIREQARNFADTMYELQRRADAIAAVFCILADRISQDWQSFDKVLQRLELGFEDYLSLPKPPPYPEMVQTLGAETSFQKFDCNNVRNALQKILPATGGGNGGGGNGG